MLYSQTSFCSFRTHQWVSLILAFQEGFYFYKRTSNLDFIMLRHWNFLSRPVFQAIFSARFRECVCVCAFGSQSEHKSLKLLTVHKGRQPWVSYCFQFQNICTYRIWMGTPLKLWAPSHPVPQPSLIYSEKWSRQYSFFSMETGKMSRCLVCKGKIAESFIKLFKIYIVVELYIHLYNLILD